MEIKELFRSFRYRLIAENAIRSLLFSAMSFGAGVFLTSLVYHIAVRPAPAKVLWAVGGAIALVAFILHFYFFYPKPKKVAARLDELGLQERVGTMLEMKDSATPLARLQREDAISCLKKVKPEQIRFRIHRREWVLCLTTLFLAFVMVLIPHDFLAFGARADADEQRSALKVSEFIDKLRTELKESNALDEETKEALEKIIEELEKELEDTDDAMEQAAKIEEAKDKVDEEMKKVISKDEIGKALQKYELTRPFGKALEDASEKDVSKTLADLQSKVKEDPTVAKELSRTVQTALEESGVSAVDELYVVLEQFSLVLKEVVPDSDTFEDALSQSFEDAERDILAILKKQKEAEKEKEKIKDAMDEAKKEALNKDKKGEGEKEESETATSEEGGKENETEEGQKENQTSENKKPAGRPGSSEGNGEGGSSSQAANMTEQIYDPVSGTVSYGEVFAIYYAEYLAALEKGEVSEELQAIMDRYYSTLNK